jgi:hypothetical protein
MNSLRGCADSWLWYSAWHRVQALQSKHRRLQQNELEQNEREEKLAAQMPRLDLKTLRELEIREVYELDMTWPAIPVLSMRRMASF